MASSNSPLHCQENSLFPGSPPINYASLLSEIGFFFLAVERVTWLGGTIRPADAADPLATITGLVYQPVARL